MTAEYTASHERRRSRTGLDLGSPRPESIRG